MATTRLGLTGVPAVPYAAGTPKTPVSEQDAVSSVWLGAQALDDTLIQYQGDAGPILVPEPFDPAILAWSPGYPDAIDRLPRRQPHAVDKSLLPQEAAPLLAWMPSYPDAARGQVVTPIVYPGVFTRVATDPDLPPPVPPKAAACPSPLPFPTTAL